MEGFDFILFLFLLPLIFPIIYYFFRNHLNRFFHYSINILKTPPEVGPVTFTDILTVGGLVLAISGLFLTLLTISLSWKLGRVETANKLLETRGSQLESTIATQEERIRDYQQQIEKYSRDKKVPILTNPFPDANIIGEHVGLKWRYSGHGKFTEYILEIIPREFYKDNQFEFNKIESEELRKCFKKKNSNNCRFPATNPSDQFSLFPFDLGDQIPAGEYFWRVVPGKFRGKAQSVDQLKIADWSAYSSFTIYPSNLNRILQTRKIRIGTTYIQDTQFSRQDEKGEATGFDIDLIRAVVGCLEKRKNEVSKALKIDFEIRRCEIFVKKAKSNKNSWQVEKPNTTDTLTAANQQTDNENGFEPEIISLSKWSSWQKKLSDQEIDIYIGSATKAKSREHGGFSFSMGYFKIRTVLLTRKNSVCKTIECLVEKGPTKIGVMEESTGQMFAEILSQNSQLREKFKATIYSSFPQLITGLFDGNVEAIFTDNTQMKKWEKELVEVKGLEKFGDEWEKYLWAPEYLGYGEETLAIAIVRSGEKENENLYKAIEDALRSDPIKEYMCYLKDSYDLHLEENSVYRCKKSDLPPV